MFEVLAGDYSPGRQNGQSAPETLILNWQGTQR
jgi:hypothetical protein